jgi:hypothetical protein
MRRAACLLLLGAAACATQPASSPGAMGTPAEAQASLRMAMSQLCFPVILDGRSEAEVAAELGLKPTSPPRDGGGAYDVGPARLLVSFIGTGSTASCVVTALGHPAEVLRPSAEAVIAARADLRPAAANPVGEVSEQRMYCGTGDGPARAVSVGNARPGAGLEMFMVMTVRTETPNQYCRSA